MPQISPIFFFQFADTSLSSSLATSDVTTPAPTNFSPASSTSPGVAGIPLPPTQPAPPPSSLPLSASPLIAASGLHASPGGLTPTPNDDGRDDVTNRSQDDVTNENGRNDVIIRSHDDFTAQTGSGVKRGGRAQSESSSERSSTAFPSEGMFIV